MTYTVHPAAALFSMMNDDDLKRLAEDIGENGLLEPIKLNHDGSLLVDGRNRQRACEMAGVVPTTVMLPEMTDEEILSHIVSANMRRNHLTPGQKAIVAARLLPMYMAVTKERQRAAGGGTGRAGGDSRTVVEEFPQPIQLTKARDLAAAAVGDISGRSVSIAKTLIEEAPDLAEKVVAGDMKLSAATTERQKRNASSDPKPAPKADRPDLEAMINEFEDRGKKYSAQDVVDALGDSDLSVDTVERKQKAVRAARKARKTADLIDWSTAPGTQQEKLRKAEARIQRDLEKVYRTRLLAEVDQHRAKLDADVAAYKARLDSENQVMRDMRDEERRHYQFGIEVQRAKGLITPREYTTILACLHPDNSASTEKRAEAFRLFNDSRIKILLVKEV